jgi:hypothetical protein
MTGGRIDYHVCFSVYVSCIATALATGARTCILVAMLVLYVHVYARIYMVAPHRVSCIHCYLSMSTNHACMVLLLAFTITIIPRCFQTVQASYVCGCR